MTVELSVCTSCRRDRSGPYDAEKTDGRPFAQAVEATAAGTPDLRVRRAGCLLQCDYGCSAGLAAPGKWSYALGNLPPTQASADMLIAFAKLYADSPDGLVPFAHWPRGIQAHFRARLPPMLG